MDPTRRLAVAATLALLAAPAVVGCKRSGSADAKPEVPTASGRVLLGGQPVNYGVVEFHGDGRVAKSVIYPDATYNIRNPPGGEVRVVVKVGQPPVPAAAGGADSPSPPHFEKIDVPPRYADPAATDLRFTATGGQDHYDVVLKP